MDGRERVDMTLRLTETVLLPAGIPVICTATGPHCRVARKEATKRRRRSQATSAPGRGGRGRGGWGAVGALQGPRK